MSTSIVDDLIRSNSELVMNPGDSNTMDMLNAATSEFSGLKKKFQSKISTLKTQVQETCEQKMRLEMKIDAAGCLLNDYLKDSSLNDVMKERFKSILAVLKIPRNTDKETDLIKESTSGELNVKSGTPMESTDIKKNASTEDNPGISVPRNIKRRQTLPTTNNDAPKKNRRRISNLPRDMPNYIPRKRLTAKTTKRFPENGGKQTKGVYKFGQSQQPKANAANPQIYSTADDESDTFSKIQKESNDLTKDSAKDTSDVPESSESLQNDPAIKIFTTTTEERNSYIYETLDTVNSSMIESATIIPSPATDVLKPGSSSQSSHSLGNGTQKSGTLNIEKSGLGEQISGDSAAHQTSSTETMDCSGCEKNVSICTQSSIKAAAVEFFTKLLKTKNENQNLNEIMENLCGNVQMLEDDKISLDQMIHVETLWKHAVKEADIIRNHPTLPNWIWGKYKNYGKYREAYDFSCQAVIVLERTLGANNRWTLGMMSRKGRTLQNLGQYTDSLKLLMEVYEKQNELFGEEDDYCLRTANLIGIVHWKLNNDEDAMKWYQSTLEKRERINEKYHSEILAIKNNIALVHNGQGKYKEAAEMYQEILEIDEITNGPEDRKTMNTKYNLACHRYNQGEYRNAKRMFKVVLKIQKKILGSDHPETLNTKDWLADTYKCLGRISVAIKLAKEVYEKRVIVLGLEHPDTILAKTYFKKIE